MTENTALSHMTPSLDERHGSVGVLLPNLECKVKDLLKAPIIFHRSLLITLWGSEDFVCVTLKFTRSLHKALQHSYDSSPHPPPKLGSPPPKLSSQFFIILQLWPSIMIGSLRSTESRLTAVYSSYFIIVCYIK